MSSDVVFLQNSPTGLTLQVPRVRQICSRQRLFDELLPFAFVRRTTSLASCQGRAHGPAIDRRRAVRSRHDSLMPHSVPYLS